MSPAKKPSSKARARKAAIKAGPSPVAPVAKKSKAVPVILGLLLVVGLASQAAWVFYRDRKTQVTLHFEMAIAPRGPGKGQVTGCRDMASSAKGELFYLQGGADSSVLQKFDRNGKWLGWVGPESPVKERLMNGYAVAADEQGGAWVVEKGTGALKHYGADMRLTETVALPSTDLNGVAQSPDGSVWVADFQGRLYQVPAGTTTAKVFTGQGVGALHAPWRLCFDPQGDLYVVDFINGQGKDAMLKSYDANGHFKKAWTMKDLPVNEFICIAWHPLGYIVVNDPRPEVVDAKGFRLYTPEGHLQGFATLTDNGQNLRSIPGFSISANGDWFLDITPLQQGCARMTWVPAL